MKIDFHIHTSERSSCAKSDESAQIETAIRSGLDAIAITDHYRLVPPDELALLNQRYSPFMILTGIEITADHEDWLVLGLPDPTLESMGWTYPDLHRYVRGHGGILTLAHPYRYRPDIQVDLHRYPPDAIEVRSNNIRSELVPSIRSLAQELQIAMLCNSDAHVTASIGKYYNICDAPIESEPDFWKALKAGLMRPSIPGSS